MMGGMRPSGLHINKPAVIGLVVFFAGCFVVYKYMWSGSAVTALSKDEISLKENSAKTGGEESPHMPNIVPEAGKQSGTPRAVVWDAKSLQDPPTLTDEINANIERTPSTLELTIDGNKYPGFAEIAVLKGTSPTQSVLFLHGVKYTSQNWIDIHVLANVASWGFKAIAVDLPGHGKTTEQIDKSMFDSYLRALIAALQIEKPVIVSPSMSGSYALPFLFQEPEKSTEKASGFVPVAPALVKEYESAFPRSQLPTLVVYGTKDTRSGVPSAPILQLLPKSITAPISEASHACYLDDPATFIKYLHSFLQKLKSDG